MEEKSQIYIIAIVAIIAIVGVIVMITSGSRTGTGTTTASEDAAGQATIGAVGKMTFSPP
jgi:ABC-type transporter Mla subunit MlaD